MKIQQKIAALVLLSAALGAQASPVTLVADFNGGMSAGYSNTLSAAGQFTDVYQFVDIGNGTLDFSGILSTASNINFESATLNGVAFDLVSEQFGVLANAVVSGPFELTVTGDALQDSASYGGTIVFAPTSAQVPEPSGIALVAGALLAAGLVRRRSKTAARRLPA